MAAAELTMRPVRPADRRRVEEITVDVFEGHDYLPRVFDDWVADAGAEFQAAEIEGVLVGVQRLRAYAPGLVWYEGLRVAPEHRRRGVARAMLASATEEARGQGFRQIRLATRDAPAMRLFESIGFRLLVETTWWRGLRSEGGEPARMPDASEAKKLWPAVAASPGIELYGGVSPDMNGARDLSADELERLAGQGMLRVGPGGRAVALLRRPWGPNIAAALIAGGGGALRELLMQLRFEADADGLRHVTVSVPPRHPAEEDLSASGYHLVDAESRSNVYALDL